MSTAIAPDSIRPGTPGDPFYYGWRDIPMETPDGKTTMLRVPLTLEDCLHPQMGDVIVESSLHERILTYLASVFRARLSDDPHALVLSDAGVYWDDPSIGHHSPDIAVIFGVREQRNDWTSFYVAEQNTRPTLIIEVVSSNTRENDVGTKVDQYHRVRVPMYVIIDRVDGDWNLVGYRWTPSEYVPMPTAKNGRLWLEPVGVWLGLTEVGVALYEASGREIGDYAKLSEERDAEADRADAERVRADAAEKRIRELEEQLKRLGETDRS